MNTAVIASPAGMGKTHMMAKMIAAKGGDGHIEVYVPTHALAVEWKSIIKTYNPSLRVTVISGRSHDIPNQGPMCKRSALADEITKAGQSVYSKLCRTNMGEVCEHYVGCRYIDQFRGQGVFIFTHAHLHLDRGWLDGKFPDLVVIDESFFLSCLGTINMNIALLGHPTIPESARGICTDVSTALRTGASLHARMAGVRKRGGGLSKALEDLRKSAPIATPSQSDAEVRAVIKSSPSLEPVALLLEHLSGAYKAKDSLQSVDYDATTGNIIAHHRRAITRFNVPDGQQQPKIFIIDATASRTIIEPFFPSSQYTFFRATRNARVIQCRSTRGSTSSLEPSKHRDPKHADDAAKRLTDVQNLIDELSQKDRKLLVVGPVAITGNPKTGAQALVRVPDHCALAHFNAIRGVDLWKSFDAILLVGRNEPPPRAVEDLARALFYDDPTPLVLAGEWASEVRGYKLQTSAEGVDVVVHPDNRVQAVLEQVRESESVQAIDRLRLIHNKVQKTVYILSNIPLDIDVDELRDWDDFIHGTRVERAWQRVNGVLPLNPDWLFSAFPDLWTSREAAKQDIRKARKRGEYTNSISIGIFTPFEYEYKPVSQRRWSRCLSQLDTPAAVKAELDVLIGQSVAVRAAQPPPIEPPEPET